MTLCTHDSYIYRRILPMLSPSNDRLVNSTVYEDIVLCRRLWQKIVEKSIKEGDGDGCWIYPNKPNPKGYVQVSLDKANIKAYTHKLAFMFKNPTAINNLPNSRKDQVSHLCHNPACCNPEHVVLEAAATNLSRRNCPILLEDVECPCGCKHRFALNYCSHKPRCINKVM
jgi:hypothetical protein